MRGDGLDEATLTGPTHVCEIRYRKITAYDMTPEELGLTVCNLEELIGGTPEGECTDNKEYPVRKPERTEAGCSGFERGHQLISRELMTAR